jgi:hypothetical protein
VVLVPEVCREHAKNVKRPKDGMVALRWCAVGMVEASKQFRRVNGQPARAGPARHTRPETTETDRPVGQMRR